MLMIWPERRTSETKPAIAGKQMRLLRPAPNPILFDRAIVGNAEPSSRALLGSRPGGVDCMTASIMASRVKTKESAPLFTAGSASLAKRSTVTCFGRRLATAP